MGNWWTTCRADSSIVSFTPLSWSGGSCAQKLRDLVAVAVWPTISDSDRCSSPRRSTPRRRGLAALLLGARARLLDEEQPRSPPPGGPHRIGGVRPRRPAADVRIGTENTLFHRLMQFLMGKVTVELLPVLVDRRPRGTRRPPTASSGSRTLHGWARACRGGIPSAATVSQTPMNLIPGSWSGVLRSRTHFGASRRGRVRTGQDLDIVDAWPRLLHTRSRMTARRPATAEEVASSGCRSS